MLPAAVPPRDPRALGAEAPSAVHAPAPAVPAPPFDGAAVAAWLAGLRGPRGVHMAADCVPGYTRVFLFGADGAAVAVTVVRTDRLTPAVVERLQADLDVFDPPAPLRLVG